MKFSRNRSDLSFEEKQKLLAGSRDLPTKSETLQAASPSFLKAAPSSLNWTQAGLVHEVQDQQQCGLLHFCCLFKFNFYVSQPRFMLCFCNCWSIWRCRYVNFLLILLQTYRNILQVMLRKNDTRRLSVQQIIDCSTANQGCAGGDSKKLIVLQFFHLIHVVLTGDPLLGLRYVKTTGLSKDSSYPYTAKQGRCKSFKAISNVSSVNRVTLNGDEKRLKDIVAAHGPVAGKFTFKSDLLTHVVVNH